MKTIPANILLPAIARYTMAMFEATGPDAHTVQASARAALNATLVPYGITIDFLNL